MSQSLSKIILHIIFSTKQRYPFITNEIRDQLYAYMVGICNNLGSYVHKINGTENNVHIVCELPRTISVSDFLEEIKKSSSKWIKSKGKKFNKFYWQKGYGAFSVSFSQLPALMKYLENQFKHHIHKSFKEELVEFFKAHKVEFDEKYLWE